MTLEKPTPLKNIVDISGSKTNMQGIPYAEIFTRRELYGLMFQIYVETHVNTDGVEESAGDTQAAIPLLPIPNETTPIKIQKGYRR